MKVQRRDFKGHTVEVRPGREFPELLIDNARVGYGRLPDGSYFLDDYAYDWSDNLVDVACRYIDHRERSAKARAVRTPGQVV